MNLDWSSLSTIVLGILIFTIGYFSKPTIIGEGKLSFNFNKMMKLTFGDKVINVPSNETKEIKPD